MIMKDVTNVVTVAIVLNANAQSPTTTRLLAKNCSAFRALIPGSREATANTADTKKADTTANAAK